MTVAPDAGAVVPRRRSVALAGVLGTVLLVAWPLLAAPAADADNLALVIDSPSEGQVVTSGTTVEVSGKVGTGVLATVDGITVQLFRSDIGIDQASACGACGSDSVVPFSYTTPALTYNGHYRVRVTATGYVVSSGIRVAPASDDRTFSVNVAPAAPGNVKATFADGKVTVTWTAVPAYPDLVGYVVYRKSSAADFAPVSDGRPPGTTSFVDSQPPAGGGNVQYRVVALRAGADPGADNWLVGRSDPVVVSIPLPSTTTPTNGQPGVTSTTVQPGGGLQPDGAVNSVGNLGNLFPSSAGIDLPAAALPSSPTIPDGTFSATLPFGAGSLPGSKVDGRQAGRSASSSGSGALDSGGESDTNRRALLVPVAAGSVLCVSALHLRWLNRRVAASSRGPGGGGGSAGDLEHADLLPADQPATGSHLVSVG